MLSEFWEILFFVTLLKRRLAEFMSHKNLYPWFQNGGIGDHEYCAAENEGEDVVQTVKENEGEEDGAFGGVVESSHDKCHLKTHSVGQHPHSAVNEINGGSSKVRLHSKLPSQFFIIFLWLSSFLLYSLRVRYYYN